MLKLLFWPLHMRGEKLEKSPELRKESKLFSSTKLRRTKGDSQLSLQYIKMSHMEVTLNDVILHKGYLLSLSLRCLAIYKNEKMKRHYTKQLFIEEAPPNVSFFNPFSKTPIILNRLNIITHELDKVGETRITPRGELIGRKPIIETKLSSHGNFICDPLVVSDLLGIPVQSLETEYNLTKEDGWFLFRFCYMTFGAALVFKGIRLKDDYYEEKFSKENHVGIGYRVYRIPDDIYRKSVLVFGGGPTFQDNSVWEQQGTKLEADSVADNVLGSIVLQNKALKYINKTQFMALKNNMLDNEPIYKAWEKYHLLNGNAEIKGLNIGNIWRLDNMLSQQDNDSLQETLDPIYYNPDGFENNEEDIKQIKNNILNLNTKNIITLQNKHSVLKTSHELNRVVKSRKQIARGINKEVNLSYYEPKSRINREICQEFLCNHLGIEDPNKVTEFVDKVIVKNDKNLISLLNDKRTNEKANEFWSVSNNTYDVNRRLQNVDIHFQIPNKNVFSWFEFLETQEE